MTTDNINRTARLSSDNSNTANKKDSNAISIPQINLPKGGGALKGIDEKFSVNAANGTASFSIPLPITPGRNGFQPSLALSYNSGAGNSPFGLGWNVDIPAIQRKTDKKLPEYHDDEDSDVFIFSGVEDLVPKMDQGNNAGWILDQEIVGAYKIKRYRPRIEGLFARIEKVQIINTPETYWRITTRDNIVTIFGRNNSCRVSDPDHPEKIFRWLPELSYDDKGNCIIFEYKEEDLKGISNTLFEKNRVAGLSKISNKYVKRIKYGNIQPYYPDYSVINNIYSPPIPSLTEYLFELVFDYGEHATNENIETANWETRPDPFSDYRPGFEIRTSRLCKRVMLFHHFTNEEFGLVNNNERFAYLVRSLDLEFESSSANSPQKSEVTYLKSIRQTGYKRNGTDYEKKSLPPIDFSYQLLNWNKDIRTVTAENIIHSPTGLSNNYNWVDLYNEGIPGILSEQADGWYYKSNLGGNEKDGAQFTAANLVSPKPSLTGLSTGALQLQDLDADGNKQIVSLQPGLSGFYELSDDSEWNNFQAFKELPGIDWQDANTRLIDLNGDGKADILITEDNVFGWYASAGKKGYENKASAVNERDEEKGPAIVFADEQQTIFLADMCGDGLTDIVRIRNGDICYWPNLGYGRFGAKVTMDNAPLFDHPDLFNPSYLHLADISGTGATDILYLGKNKFSAWLNLSGNSWSEPCQIDPFFSTESPNQIAVVDLLGNGTSCIVWSSPLPVNANAPMRYIDLMGGNKPHVLTGYKNNFGKETSFEYKSSSQYYLEDKKAGRQWITKLPFPVQCLSKVTVTDTVSALRFSNLYAYHHGYYDHIEKEFRGFGMVEQKDTEEFELLQEAAAANGTDPIFHEPPVLTKTWFHLGAYFRNKKILEHYVNEYWYNEPDVIKQYGNVSKEYSPDAIFADELSTEELIEAHRACKGMVLRQEVFALDDLPERLLPYSVATHNCYIKRKQAASGNHKAVFMVNESEAITFSYERNISDPRIAHSLNMEFDDHGNVLKNVAVVYPRKIRPAELTDDRIWDEQNKQHIIFNENNFTSNIETPGAYRLRLPYKTRSFEVSGLELSPGKEYYSIADFAIPDNEIGYQEEFTTGIIQKRLIEHVKTIYLSNDLKTKMPEGKHDSLGFVYESYQLAFTPTLVDSIYNTNNNSRVNANMLEDDGKYFKFSNEVNWWIRSGFIDYLQAAETSLHAAQRFYVPLSYTDPFGFTTMVGYDNYFLLLKNTKDELDNETVVEKFDYRSLSATRVRDMNANISEVRIDILGLVAGTALMDKGNEGDDLNAFVSDPDANEVESFFNPSSANDQLAVAKTLLKNATSRLLYDFSRTPCVAATIVREKHYKTIEHGQPVINNDPKVQFSFEYSDGLGNIILKKVRAEAGDTPYRDQNGKLVKLANGELDARLTDNRWVGNGRTILNNKGKPVKQYEPYFIEGHLYEIESELRESGVTPVLHYDAAGRLVKTKMPDDSFSEIKYDSWQQQNYDQNDTVDRSDWYRKRITQSLEDYTEKDAAREKAAAERSAIHANTPSTVHLDSLGRPFMSVQHNRIYDIEEPSGIPINITDSFYSTFTVLDIEGNVRSVIDACANTVMSYKYDMLGHQVYQNSMDAAERWLLNDCMGKPTYAWDSKGRVFYTEYDDLHRPSFVTRKDNTGTITTDRFKYCDTRNLSPMDLLANQSKNLIGKLIEQSDSAGKVEMIEYDFKGNLLKSSRQLCKDYDSIPDWDEQAPPPMQAEIFYSSTEFDALNRPARILTPNTEVTTTDIPASVIVPEYNDANLLNGVKVSIRGTTAETEFVTNIEYDAKGQRKSIEYGNQTFTEYTYDKKTFRLLRLLTTKEDQVFQDLHYTYDAVGNITHIYDNAFEPVFFNNQRIDALSDYNYDALYQLIRAKGREHAGQNSINESSSYQNGNNYRHFPFQHPNDSQALRGYTENYKYDQVGNILEMNHSAGAIGSWTRTYWYNNNDDDRNEVGVNGLPPKNNQLLKTQVGNDSFEYEHDVHGNMVKLPHLSHMNFNHKDQLESIDLGGGGNAYYVYDSSGQRIRKVIVKNGITEERIYLGAFEIFRKKDNGDTVKQVETLHIMDDTRRIAMVDTPAFTDDDEDEQVIRYIYSNHLGSSSLELNEDAETISYEEYHPYGTTSYSLINTTIKAAAKRYRYTGMERDEESGMAYHTARYYLPWLGRWLSADPIGSKGGLNLYQFASSNPLLFTDNNGMQPDVKVTNTRWMDESSSYPAVLQELEREGIKARLLTVDMGYKKVSTLYRWNVDHWYDVTNQATKDGPLSIEWNMPRPMKDKSTLEKVLDFIEYTPGEMIVGMIPPSVVIPNVKDSILMDYFEFTPPGLNPYVNFSDKIARRWGATGARKVDYWLNAATSVAGAPSAFVSKFNEAAKATKEGLRMMKRISRAASVTSETAGSITTLTGKGVKIGEFKPGRGNVFSGVIDPVSKEMMMFPTEGTLLPSGYDLANVVPRRGGHEKVLKRLEEAMGRPLPDAAAFTAQYTLDANGNAVLQVIWNSRSVNGVNYGSRYAGYAFKQEIVEALEKATGLRIEPMEAHARFR